ncbi:jupiter microtubule associated homolog 1-like isoform X2 [Sardina pilchardus]|uniref:jupiter microtubule associated homolog 1-like isoform X2 n=1 Tax=Sardina pilchardus TaxID=27697 RepID=UPI002E0FBA1F
MTTTTTFKGLEPGSKSSSRVLRPPGGASNISFGADEEKATRKNKMASNIFAEPEDPHAHRRNNPPGGKPTGVLCGESSAPLRRCQNQLSSQDNLDQDGPAEVNSVEDVDHDTMNAESTEEPEAREPREDTAPSGGGSSQAAGVPSGRRNPPGGKSSLILG